MKSYGTVNGRAFREEQPKAEPVARKRETSAMCPTCGKIMPIASFEVKGGPCSKCRRRILGRRFKPKEPPEIEIVNDSPMPGNEASLSDRIMWLQKSSGMPKCKFSRICGLSPGYLDKVRRGGLNPSAKVLVRICQACGVSADWLLGLE